MSEVQQKLKELPGSATRKINSIYGSIDKFYATVYLIARNEHQCQMMAVPAADQRMKTIRAYQGLIRFMLDELGLDGKNITKLRPDKRRVHLYYQTNRLTGWIFSSLS